MQDDMLEYVGHNVNVIYNIDLQDKMTQDDFDVLTYKASREAQE